MVSRCGKHQQHFKKKLTNKDKGDTPKLIFHYVMRILVYEFRIVDLKYFMDICTEWEINDMIDNIPYLDRNLWESQRLNAYITAQVNSKKKLTQQDVCKFKWEDKNIEDFVKDEKDYEISTDDINRLKDIAAQWEK